MISSFYEKIVGTSSLREPSKLKTLCVGLNCLDIVQVCRQFPIEDSDQRCVDLQWRRGGNASNNCTVLSQAGSSCEYLGTLSSEHHLTFLEDDMRKYNINFSHCPTVNGTGCPTSIVILSLNSGTRTILHHNPNLPELSLKDFEKLNLDEYSWIHFEGRNVAAVLSMMKHIEAFNDSLKTSLSDDRIPDSISMPITVSVEIEKANEQLLVLLPHVDIVFVGRTFAQFRGFDNMSDTLRSISQSTRSGAAVICAWGDRGAMAQTPDGTIVQSPAFPPHKIIDSLGAGDTFNAAMLFYLNKAKLSFNKKLLDTKKNLKVEMRQSRDIKSLEQSHTEFIDSAVLQSAVTFSCKVAGAKIGLQGYDGLDKVFKVLLS